MSYSVNDNGLFVTLPPKVANAINKSIVVGEFFLSGLGCIDCRFRFTANWSDSMSLDELVLWLGGEPYNDKELIGKIPIKSRVKKPVLADPVVDAMCLLQLNETVTKETIGSEGLQGSNIQLMPRMTISEARRLNVLHNLSQRNVNGVLNLYPGNSLTDQDFERLDDEHLQARVTLVAHYLGKDSALQKINSSLDRDPAHSLCHWWDTAGSTDRAWLLSNAKKFKGKVANVKLDRLLRFPYPFC